MMYYADSCFGESQFGPSPPEPAMKHRLAWWFVPLQRWQQHRRSQLRPLMHCLASADCWKWTGEAVRFQKAQTTKRFVKLKSLCWFMFCVSSNSMNQNYNFLSSCPSLIMTLNCLGSGPSYASISTLIHVTEWVKSGLDTQPQCSGTVLCLF